MLIRRVGWEVGLEHCDKSVSVCSTMKIKCFGVPAEYEESIRICNRDLNTKIKTLFVSNDKNTYDNHIPFLNMFYKHPDSRFCLFLLLFSVPLETLQHPLVDVIHILEFISYPNTMTRYKHKVV